MAADKHRLDARLVELGLAVSLKEAQGLILAGKIVVDDHLADKPGLLVGGQARVARRGETCPFVSRGGLKLAKGLDFFGIKAAGLVCADIGASTGGFTDCLLTRQAARVYAIDVGYGQLDFRLRQDPRVVVRERTNARHLSRESLPEPIDLAVIDASFISLKLLLPPLLPLFRGPAAILALIKPQFEVKRGQTEGGVVNDPLLWQAAIDDILARARELGLMSQGITESPILGPKGNREFLVYLTDGEQLTSFPCHCVKLV